MRVAVLANFPLHVIPSLSGEIPPQGHYATWLPPLAEANSIQDGIERYWITLCDAVTERKEITFCNQTFIILPTQKKGRSSTLFKADRLAIKNVLQQIQPDIVHGWGTEDVYALSAVTSGYPSIVSMQGILSHYIFQTRTDARTLLQALFEFFILRRTKKEVAQELPQKVEMDLLCPLTDVQRTEYARICSEGLERLGDDVGAAMREKSFGFLALLTRLRQTCCDPDMLPWLKSPLSDSGKINLLVEKLAEVIGSGHKVVIFSQFVMLLDRVRAALVQNFPDLPRYELTGMTLDRLKPVQQFQNAPGAAAMLVSLKAAGTGITLHAADYVFLLDPWWNPAVEAQAIDRVHRIGQTNTVFVYRLVTAGTIEERIQALKEEKKDLFDKLIGGLGGDFDLSQHFSSLRGLVQLTTQVEQDPAIEPGAYTID